MSKLTRKVLLLDDETELLTSLKSYLEACFDEVQILTGSDGVEGKNLFLDNSLDLIICDINMPNMNGLEFLDFVQQNGYTGEFIFLSGYLSEERKKTLTLRRCHILPKPYRHTNVKKIVKNCFDYSSLVDLYFKKAVLKCRSSNLSFSEFRDLMNENKKELGLKRIEIFGQQDLLPKLQTTEFDEDEENAA